jgi:hypothetical protein
MAMTLEERMYRGDKAREIIENDVYRDAFEQIRQELINAWEISPARDAEGREKIYLMLGLLGKVERALTATMEDGKIAKHELNHHESLLEKAKQFVGL